MTDSPTPDWTSWIITTCAAALSSAIGMVIYLTKYIGNKFADEVKDLNLKLADMEKKHDECTKGHHDAELRLARLEEQVKLNTSSRLHDEDRNH